MAASKSGPFQEFYTALLTKGMRPEMGRLTLARNGRSQQILLHSMG